MRLKTFANSASKNIMCMWHNGPANHESNHCITEALQKKANQRATLPKQRIVFPTILSEVVKVEREKCGSILHELRCLF